MNPRRMLGRNIITDYITLEGLERLTSENPENFDLWILKELIDNSLDACDEIGYSPIMQITVTRKEKFLTLTVKDNGPGIGNEGIKKITDWTKLYSSRYHYMYPTRGALGNAWKCILGITYALASANKVEYKEPPVEIKSQGRKYSIKVEYRDEEVSSPPDEQEIPQTIGTTVNITLPIYSKRWLQPGRYRPLIEGFAYFNPQARLSFEDHDFEKYGFVVAESNSMSKREIKLRESAHWFSSDGFRDRIEAEVHDGLESGEHRMTPDFIKQFWGLTSHLKVKRIKMKTGLQTDFLEDLTSNEELIERLFNAMREESKPPSASVLNAIGEKEFIKRVNQIDGILHHRFSRYRCKPAITTVYRARRRVEVPFIVEAVATVNQQEGMFLHVAVNGSPKMEDPFAPYVFEYKNGKNCTGIRGILQKNGVKYEEPVTVLVHITCPNIQYHDPGKTKIDITPFHAAVKEVVDRATKFYNNARREITTYKNTGYVPKNIKEVVLNLLPEAIDFVSSGGRFRYKQRQLWYVLRALIQEKGLRQYSPRYDYFQGKLIPQAMEETEINLEGLLKEANAELHEPRSETSIPLSTEGVESYKIPEWKYNKILYVEKRGFKDVIVANKFHDRYDVAVIGAQGESSVASRDLLRGIEQIAAERGEDITILCIHDADLWGHDISITLSHPTQRLKTHRLNLIDLGLTMKEAMKLGLTVEKVTHNKPQRMPEKLLRYLPQEELLLLTGEKRVEELNKQFRQSYRVELNAFTPEQFMNWLTEKLEQHGIKEKVRPPDDIIQKETEDRIDENLEEKIKMTILKLCGGQKLVNHLKTKIIAKETLDKLDISEVMDETLKTYPTEGWNDIINNNVKNVINKTFEKDWVTDETRKDILTHLKDEDL